MPLSPLITLCPYLFYHSFNYLSLFYHSLLLVFFPLKHSSLIIFWHSFFFAIYPLFYLWFIRATWSWAAAVQTDPGQAHRWVSHGYDGCHWSCSTSTLSSSLPISPSPFLSHPLLLSNALFVLLWNRWNRLRTPYSCLYHTLWCTSSLARSFTNSLSNAPLSYPSLSLPILPYLILTELV